MFSLFVVDVVVSGVVVVVVFVIVIVIVYSGLAMAIVRNRESDSLSFNVFNLHSCWLCSVVPINK